MKSIDNPDTSFNMFDPGLSPEQEAVLVPVLNTGLNDRVIAPALTASLQKRMSASPFSVLFLLQIKELAFMLRRGKLKKDAPNGINPFHYLSEFYRLNTASIWESLIDAAVQIPSDPPAHQA